MFIYFFDSFFETLEIIINKSLKNQHTFSPSFFTMFIKIVFTQQTHQSKIFIYFSQIQDSSITQLNNRLRFLIIRKSFILFHSKNTHLFFPLFYEIPVNTRNIHNNIYHIWTQLIRLHIHWTRICRHIYFTHNIYQKHLFHTTILGKITFPAKIFFYYRS